MPTATSPSLSSLSVFLLPSALVHSSQVFSLYIYLDLRILLILFLDRRLKFLCDPQLVDGFIETEDLPVKPTKNTGSRVVKWESTRPNKLLRNKLYPRLMYAEKRGGARGEYRREEEGRELDPNKAFITSTYSRF